MLSSAQPVAQAFPDGLNTMTRVSVSRVFGPAGDGSNWTWPNHIEYGGPVGIKLRTSMPLKSLYKTSLLSADLMLTTGESARHGPAVVRL
jgi:hypothetical protein